MDDTFDTKFFIDLVRERPILWDVKNEEYSNKIRKQQCWNEVCGLMVDNFEELREDVKQKKCAEILRRWKSLRNCFTREIAKQKSSDVVPGRKPYIYFEMLTFLQPSSNSTTGAKIETDMEEGIEPAAFMSESYFSMRDHAQEPTDDSNDQWRMLNETLRESIHMRLKKTAEDDDDKLFLLSLHSHLKTVPESKKLLAKADLIQVLLKYTIKEEIKN